MVTKQETLTLFTGFLMSRNLLNTYLDRCKRHTNIDNLQDMQRFLEDDEMPDYDFIGYGFDWTDTPEGTEYWQNLHEEFCNLWRRYNDSKGIGQMEEIEFRVKLTESMIYHISNYLKSTISDLGSTDKIKEWRSGYENWNKAIIELEKEGKL